MILTKNLNPIQRIKKMIAIIKNNGELITFKMIDKQAELKMLKTKLTINVSGWKKVK